MALPKKKKVVKVLKKKAVVKKAEPATKKGPSKKTAAAVKKKKVMAKKPAKKVVKINVKAKASAVPKGDKKAGKGKYPYEPYRAKKNVGNAAKNAILQGKGTDDVLDVVMEAFPECSISKASVGYYRTALRKEGYDY